MSNGLQGFVLAYAIVRGSRPISSESILFPALAVAFAAFCIWLTVRIVNRRERWSKWTAVVVALLVLYVASFGLACRLGHDEKVSARTIYRCIGQ